MTDDFGASRTIWPTLPDKQATRQMSAVQQLPEMIHHLRELEKQVAQLAAKLNSQASAIADCPV